MSAIDLNCDLGESPASIADGTDEALMASLTSVNVACGGHAGDDATMEATLRHARRLGVAIGAHPGFPDRGRFGRVDLALDEEELAATVESQLRALLAVATRLGTALRHVKPHGALYHAASAGGAAARAIATAVARVNPGLVLFGLAGSRALATWEARGFAVVAEAFADRRYEPDGSLRDRRHADALLTDPEEAAEQAARIALGRGVVAHGGTVVPVAARSLCVHGDTPGAPAIARAVRARLASEHVRIEPP